MRWNWSRRGSGRFSVSKRYLDKVFPDDFSLGISDDYLRQWCSIFSMKSDTRSITFRTASRPCCSIRRHSRKMQRNIHVATGRMVSWLWDCWKTCSTSPNSTLENIWTFDIHIYIYISMSNTCTSTVRVRSLSAKDRKVRCKFIQGPGCDGVYLCNGTRHFQALLNLRSNSVKYMGEDSTAILTCQATHHSSRGHQLAFTVEYDGPVVCEGDKESLL